MEMLTETTTESLIFNTQDISNLDELLLFNVYPGTYDSGSLSPNCSTAHECIISNPGKREESQDSF